MLQRLSSHNIVRTLAVALATMSTFAILPQDARAQSVSSNADNQFEYNAYVYSYMGWAVVKTLPGQVQSDIDSAPSIAERQDFELERNLAYAARNRARAAFNHAYRALLDNDNSQWSLCLSDLQDAIEDLETLRDYQELIGADYSRKNTVQSAISYLETASDAAFMANMLSGRWNGTIDLPGRG